MRFTIAAILGLTQATADWTCKTGHQLDPQYVEDTSNKPVYMDHYLQAEVQDDQGTQMYIPIEDADYDGDEWCVEMDVVLRLEGAKGNNDYVGFQTHYKGPPPAPHWPASAPYPLTKEFARFRMDTGEIIGAEKTMKTGLQVAKSTPYAISTSIYQKFENLSFFINKSTGTITYAQNGKLIYQHQDAFWITAPTPAGTQTKNSISIYMGRRHESVNIHHKNWQKVYEQQMTIITDLYTQMRHNDKKMMDIEKNITILNTDNRKCHQTLSEQITTITKNTNDVTTCNNHVTAKKTAVTHLKTQSDGCTKKVTALTNTMLSWTKQWERCVDTVTVLTTSINAKQQRIDTLHNNMHSNSTILAGRKAYLDVQVTKLNAEIARFDTTISTLHTSITTTTSRTSVLRTTLESATTRVATYKAAVARLITYDRALLEKYVHVLAITIRLDHSNLELRKMNLDLQRNYDTVLISDSHLRAENAQLVLENTDYENTIRYLKLEEHDSSTTVTITVHHHESDNEQIVRQEETTVTHTSHTEATGALQEEEPKESSIGATGASIIAVSVISLGAGAFLIFKKAFSQKRAGLYHDL